jgi:hypothetical protein
MMKSGKKKFLVWMLKLALAVLVCCLLVRCGLHPFLSVLVLLYWKTAIALGLFIVGLAWFAHSLMH